jgi:hypothetical protein
MRKLRIKISGCMRSVAGAGEFCAVRSCPATAACHGTGAPGVLASAFAGRPWIPGTGQASPAPKANAVRVRAGPAIALAGARTERAGRQHQPRG